MANKKTKFILDIEKKSAMKCYTELINILSKESDTKLITAFSMCERVKKQKKYISKYYDDQIKAIK